MSTCADREPRPDHLNTHTNREKKRPADHHQISAQYSPLVSIVVMEALKPKASCKIATATRATAPGSPRKGPPKFKQRSTRQFKSKPPKKGVIGFGEDIPGMEWLGTDFNTICPWEAYSHLELHELTQYGII